MSMRPASERMLATSLWLGRCILASLLLAPAIPAARVHAQVTPPARDTTVRVDTLALRAMRADSIRADSLRADSVAQVRRHFPMLPNASSAAFAGGERIWDRDALLREGAVTLLDLLERMPSITALRSGLFVQPEAIASFGGTAGRVEVELDGFALDPLDGSTLDLAHIPLGQLREVRVERRLGLLRIRLFTDHPFEGRPYTRVEAGIGQPDANMFRGLFLVPHVIAGPLGLGVERMDTDGTDGAEPANVFNAWGKWTWTNGRRGLQLEIMRSNLKREIGSPWPVERLRQDLVLRARNEFMPGLVADAYVGRSGIDEGVPQASADTTEQVRTERTALQAGARIGFQRSFMTLGGTFRFRDADALPKIELIVDADVKTGPLHVKGEVGQASWDGAAGDALYTSAMAIVGPFIGLSAFGEITNGDRGAPVYGDSTFDSLLTTRKAWRAGLSMKLGSRASGSIALVNMEQSPSRPFGLPFDTIGRPRDTLPAKGLEAHGRFVIIRDWLAIESFLTDWRELGNWRYLPVRSWRTTLEAHASPLPTGNLEILGRIEGSQRSAMLAWDPEDTNPFSNPITLPGFTTFDAYLQIRVIDVRAFIRFEDITDAQPEILPGRIRTGPRIFYGVKWNLWN